MAVIIYLLAILVAMPAAAASSDRIETITVTAHRLPTSESVLPVLVRSPTTAPPVGADVLRSFPSLAISQAGNLGSVTQVRIRGSEANHLMVLMDGVDITDPATDSSYNFANLGVGGTTRIELAPGSHSAIWGSDALAGVLQIITTPYERIRRVHAEAGSFDTFNGRLQLADRQNSHYYNLNVENFVTKGTNVAEVGDEDDGFEQRSLHFSGGLTGERWTVATLLRGVRSRVDFDPTPFPSFLPRDGDNETEHDEIAASMALTWHELDHFEQTLQVSYFETENRSFENGVREAITAAERSKVTSLSRFVPSKSHTLTLLMEYQRERFEQAGAASSFGDPNQRQSIETTSVAGEYILCPLESLTVAFSARGDRNTDFDDTESFRAGARFTPRPGLEAWAAWGTGVKNPSFVERFGFTPDTFIGNADLQPELNRHLSAGVNLTHGIWSVAASVYRDRLQDEINGFFFEPSLGGFTSVNESGPSKRDGAELELSASYGSATFLAGISYLDAREPDGSTEIRRPEWQGYVTLRHEGNRLTAETSAFYVGEQIDLDFATFPATPVTLDSYVLMRAYLAYRLTDRITVAVRGENLLDESYQDQLGYASPGRAGYLQLQVNL